MAYVINTPFRNYGLVLTSTGDGFDNLLSYAPIFEEVDGAYWFRIVHPSVPRFFKNDAC